MPGIDLKPIHRSDEPQLCQADALFPHARRAADEANLIGAFEGDELLGIIAFDPEWVWHLNVRPAHQKRGIGSRLLSLVFEIAGPKKAIVYEDNEAACRFFEARGFMAVAFGDGSRNAEKKPDVLYLWGRAEG